jgi:pSer/pThr/pTyr-binding forkhead associated (FHA) protein
MQHKEFEVGVEGAGIGRKQSNAVSLSQEKGEEVLGLDSAVSGEHCRIEFRPAEGGFVLLDGTRDKGSTNGTWLRLSFMHQPSDRQPLDREDEVLIGGILRFVVGFEMSLMEREVPHEEHGDADSDDSAATSPDQIKVDVARSPDSMVVA